MTIEISKWAKIAAEAVRTINPSIASEEWIQIAINDACQEKDARIAVLERNLEDARNARDILMDDKFGLEVQLELLAKDKSIAELSALLEDVPHIIDDQRAGDFAPGHEPCAPNCPRCAYEGLKAK